MARWERRQASIRYTAISAQLSALPVPALGMLLTHTRRAVACSRHACCCLLMRSHGVQY
jgi:hypothetical protein